MKKSFTTLCAIAAACAALVSCGQQAATPAENETEAGTTAVKAADGSIVYFNIDKVMAEYNMAVDLFSAFNAKKENIEQELNKKGSAIEREFKKFNDDYNKGILLPSVAQERAGKIQTKQQNFQNEAAQKQQELANEFQTLNNQVADAVKTYIDTEFNADGTYAMILATQGALLPIPVVSGAAELDITEALLAGLNEAYLKDKSAE